MEIEDTRWNETKHFNEVIQAMELLGMSDSSERDRVFQLVAGILHFGNIEFVEGDDPEHAAVANPDTLELAARLFEVRERPGSRPRARI